MEDEYEKAVLVYLALILSLVLCSAFAEQWKCPKCRRVNTGNFCPDGYLYINGDQYAEEYIDDVYRAGFLNTFGPYTVPKNSCFVLGDHRNNSNDSRSVNALPAEMIIGKAIEILCHFYKLQRTHP